MENEIEINLGRLFINVMKHWRQILLFLLIGLLIGCGVSFLKMRELTSENIDSYLTELVEDEKVNEDTIRLYALYNNQYKTLLERSNNSLILTMNPNSVWNADFSYLVTDENREAMIAFFDSLLYEKKNLDLFIKASGLDCSSNDIKEMISLSYSEQRKENITLEDTTLTISIVAPTEKSLDGITQAISELINSKQENFSQYLLGSRKDFGYSSIVDKAKSSYVDSLQNILKQLKDFKGKFSSDEELYYAYYYDAEAFAKMEFCFSIKWPVILAIVFVLADAFFLACAFIFSKTVTNENEVSELFNLPILGSVDKPKTKKGLDKLFDKWEKASLPATINSDYLIQIIKNLSKGCVSLIFDANDSQSKELADTLVLHGGGVFAGR